MDLMNHRPEWMNVRAVDRSTSLRSHHRNHEPDDGRLGSQFSKTFKATHPGVARRSGSTITTFDFLTYPVQISSEG